MHLRGKNRLKKYLDNAEILFHFTDPKLRDCLPSDFIFGGETYAQVNTAADCLKDCLKTEFEESVAISEVLQGDQYGLALF